MMRFKKSKNATFYLIKYFLDLSIWSKIEEARSKTIHVIEKKVNYYLWC